ncbi:glycoside hydrolase family 18 [Fusarium denticulatum]|uniref:Glycoside hydrolase family 18 n=1 Tax=Fusarium denticulatum TaxID=48507 RepID=A0A8H5XCS6_9HYPO|nr:glycoside hydrolase family 18 [Fusarium denticulatum]
MAATATGRGNTATEKKSVAPRSEFQAAMLRTAACGKGSLGRKVKCPLNEHWLLPVCQYTFAVKTWHQDDVKLYKEFTGIKKKGLESWIAIGGWSFSDFGPTRTTFSDLSPNGGAPNRGGRKEDTDYYVPLLKDMSAAFGSKYEIDQPVENMEIMAYDLHGPWDEDVKQIGRVTLGYTNIPEIANWSLPLYDAGVDLVKINMGLDYYARRYTVADLNCNGVGGK